MSEKIGIEIETLAQDLLKQLKDVKKEISDIKNVSEGIGGKDINNRALSNQVRLMRERNEQLERSQKLHGSMSRDGTLNTLNGAGGQPFNRQGASSSVWGSAINSAFGSVLNGRFGSAAGGLLSTGATQIGATVGGPVGAVIGQVAGTLFKFIGGKLDESAERVKQNWIRTSYLNSSIGGIGSASWNRLYANVGTASEQIGRMTHAETIQLFNTVAKASGKTDAATLMSDSIIAGQYGKALGMDTNTSGRFFGQMRSLGVASNEMQMRRVGTVIGEAIGKTGAFAKADEMMSAVSNFAAVSARVTMQGNSGAVERYTGLLSELASGGIKDVSGIASVLMQADQGFRNGGGKGLASWNFRLGAYQQGYSRSVNAFDIRYLNEQGLFGSASDVFDRNSKYYNFATAAERRRYDSVRASMQRNGTWGKSNIDVMMAAMQRRTGGGALMADALANEFGLTTSQAISLFNAYKEYGSSAGIGNVLSSQYGLKDLSAQQTLHAASFLKADKGSLLQQADKLRSGVGFTNGLNKSELERLNKAVEKGNEKELRQVIIELSATRKYEEDQGARMEASMKTIENKMNEFGGQFANMQNNLYTIAYYAADGVTSGDSNVGIETNANGDHEILGLGPGVQTINKNAFAGGSGISSQQAKNAQILAEAAEKAGVPAHMAVNQAVKESRLNADEKAKANGVKTTAGGLLQMSAPTYKYYAKKLGLPTDAGARFNAYNNARAGTAMMADAIKALRRWNIPVNEENANMYMFLGPGGARSFFKALRENPNAIAANYDKYLRQAADSNYTVFNVTKGEGKNRRFVRQRTVAEVYQVQNEAVQKSREWVNRHFGNGRIEGDIHVTVNVPGQAQHRSTQPLSATVRSRPTNAYRDDGRHRSSSRSR